MSRCISGRSNAFVESQSSCAALDVIAGAGDDKSGAAFWHLDVHVGATGQEKNDVMLAFNSFWNTVDYTMA